MAVDNTAEIYTTINVTLAVKQTFESLQSYLETMQTGYDDNSDNSIKITEHFMHISHLIKRLTAMKNNPLFW